MSRLVQLERPFTVTKGLSEDGTFEGYASAFDIEDHAGHTVKRGAFKKHLQTLVKQKRSLKMLWQHDRDQPIGKFTTAEEDKDGLYVVGKLTLGVQKANDIRLLMLDDVIDSMSIGGYVIKEKTDNKTFKSDLLEIELREISPVTFPALDAARINSVKSLTGVEDMAALELYLRDVGGFSIKDAKTIISKAKGVSPQRDVGLAISAIQSAINNLKG